MERNVITRPAIGAGLILIIPLVLTILDRNKAEGVGWHWSPLDYLVMGAIIFGGGVAYELISRRLGSSTHKVLLGLAISFLVLAIWAELAVGAVSQLVGSVVG